MNLVERAYRELLEKYNRLLEENKYSEFIKTADELNVVDLAEYLTTISNEQLPKVLRMFKKDKAAVKAQARKPGKQSSFSIFSRGRSGRKKDSSGG